METKCDESFSAASGDSLGAHRLGDVSIGFSSIMLKDF